MYRRSDRIRLWYRGARQYHFRRMPYESGFVPERDEVHFVPPGGSLAPKKRRMNPVAYYLSDIYSRYLV